MRVPIGAAGREEFLACCTALAQTRTVRPGAGSQFGRSVARSGPLISGNAGPGHRQGKVGEWLTAGRCRVWHDCAPPHSTMEKPSVHSSLPSVYRVMWK
jgi:hypothetical protein